jgi:hypothetical protein
MKIRAEVANRDFDMKHLKRTNWFAGLGVAAALAVTPALGLAQTTVYAPATSRTTTTTVTNGPAVNPNSPVQFPAANVGMAPDSHQGKIKAAYVDQQIALAKSRGQNTSAAETQEIQGQSDLRRGLNAEAGQHFDAALRSIGAEPHSPTP